MFKFVALFALIAIASSAAVHNTYDPVPIVRSESNIHPDGSFVFNFEGADGTYREESGTIHNPGQENAYAAVVGSYKYIDADGQTIEVQYTADENGFIPVGQVVHPDITNNARQVAGISH